MSWFRSPIIRLMNHMLKDYDTSGPVKKAMISTFMHHFPGQMTCVEFDEFMSDYLDGSLSEPENRKFNFHLDACPMCRAHLSEYHIAVELARSSPAQDLPAVPPELIDAILASRTPRDD